MSTAAILPGFILPASATLPSGTATASSAATFGELLSSLTATGQDTAQQGQGEAATDQPETPAPEIPSAASGQQQQQQQQQQQWARALQPLPAPSGPSAEGPASAVAVSPAPAAGGFAAAPALPGTPEPAVHEQPFPASQGAPLQAPAAPAEKEDAGVDVPVAQAPAVGPGPSAVYSAAQTVPHQVVVQQHSPSTTRGGSPAPLTGPAAGRGPVSVGQQALSVHLPAGAFGPAAAAAPAEPGTPAAPAPVQSAVPAPTLAAASPVHQPVVTPASHAVGYAPAPVSAPATLPVAAGPQPVPAASTTLPAETATAPAPVAAPVAAPAGTETLAPAAVEAAPRTAEAPPFQTVPSAATDGPRAAAAAQATAPAPAAPQQPMATQLARPLFTLATEVPGEHVMTMKVSPEDLGPVTVRAHISSEGVKLELFAAGDAGREAVRAALPELRRELAAQGLGASLDLSGRNSPEQQSQPQSQQHRGNHSQEGPYRPNLRMVSDGEPATGQALRSSASTAALDVIA